MADEKKRSDPEEAVVIKAPLSQAHQPPARGPPAPKSW